jgi:hypothetical protein
MPALIIVNGAEETLSWFDLSCFVPRDDAGSLPAFTTGEGESHALST